MARRGTKSPAIEENSTVPATPDANVDGAKPPRLDTSAIDVEALAQAILGRVIKPRVGEIRRLAEAVLRKKARKKAKKAKKEAGKGNRKLSKIPAPKGKL